MSGCLLRGQSSNTHPTVVLFTQGYLIQQCKCLHVRVFRSWLWWFAFCHHFSFLIPDTGVTKKLQLVWFKSCCSIRNFTNFVTRFSLASCDIYHFLSTLDLYKCAKDEEWWVLTISLCHGLVWLNKLYLFPRRTVISVFSILYISV